MLIGVATVYITFDLARRIFPSLPLLRNGKKHSFLSRIIGHFGEGETIAWLSAIFVAVYPGFLTSSHLLLSETLFTFLLVLAFDLIAASVGRSASPASSPGKGGRREGLILLAAGAAWGAATLTRGITLYFVFPLMLWLAFQWSPEGQTNGKGLDRSVRSVRSTLRATPAIAFVLGMVATIAPWTIRNATVFHQVVLLETKGGVNFWLGNSPYTPNDFIRNVWKTGVREPMLAALPTDEFERDRASYGLGASFVAREPWTFVARMPVKFADFWGFERNLVDAAEATRGGKAGGWTSLSKVAADFVSDAAYVVLMLLALAGLVFSSVDKWKLLIGGFVLYFVFAHMVVFGDGRFHLPLVPMLCLYAAWCVAGLAGLKLRFRPNLLRSMAAVALVLVFTGVWAHEILAAWLELRGGL